MGDRLNMNGTVGEKRIKYHILISLIIILQIIYITYVFAFKKNGYHSDELWNYGFANSSESECIYVKDGKTINAYEWIDSSVLLDYISVDESEIFDYKSIYENATKDLNPPFQYFLLHAISSIKTNTWSKWYCYIINILAFLITQVFLYKTLEMACGKSTGVYGILFFGFCAGAANITVYLRLYALGVAFATMFFYYSFEFFNDRTCPEKTKRDLIKIMPVVFAGCLTMHQFLVFAFSVALFYSLYYLFKKDFRNLFLYGGICLIAVLLSIAVFPYAFYHLFGYSNSESFGTVSVVYQLWDYLSFLFRDITGVYISLTPTASQAVIGMIITVLVAVILIIFAFSKRKRWFIELKSRMKNILLDAKDNIKKRGFVLLPAAFSVVFIICVCSINTNVFVMGVYSRRYLFLIYPVFAILLAALFGLIFNKRALMILAILFSLLSNFVSDGAFLFRFKGDEEAFDKIEKNADCIIVLKDLWVMTNAVNELYDTDKFYLTDRERYKADNYDENIGSNNPVYLLIDVSDERDMREYGKDADFGDSLGYFSDKEEYLLYYSELPIAGQIEYIGVDFLFDRKIEVYRLR